MEAINSDEDIRPYLSQYPYKIENIEIDIYIYGKNHEQKKHPEISIMGLYKGNIRYFTQDKEISDRYITKQSETFKQALHRLREQGKLPEYFKNWKLE